MKILEWEEIKNNKPEDYLTKEEYVIWLRVLMDFNERVKNTKNIKRFAESGLGLSAWRYASQHSDSKKAPNLYKTIYALVFNYDYEK